MCFGWLQSRCRGRLVGIISMEGSIQTSKELDFYGIIEHINKHEGLGWVIMGPMCDKLKSKNKPLEGAESS
ncbi:hypothetical protein BDV34DRAFT_203800 [Aspergillus parasiticus]|uniref:Uncharacterized protein n=1 Tax=Aspergillus parasiticus TaxID=5067 RepID=A0A5N6D6R0_ASPPA|nr:hypothetical protein BDV34DRAFT_203800 [Aspergillus parasiticus]